MNTTGGLDLPECRTNEPNRCYFYEAKHSMVPTRHTRLPRVTWPRPGYGARQRLRYLVIKRPPVHDQTESTSEGCFRYRSKPDTQTMQKYESQNVDAAGKDMTIIMLHVALMTRTDRRSVANRLFTVFTARSVLKGVDDMSRIITIAQLASLAA